MRMEHLLGSLSCIVQRETGEILKILKKTSSTPLFSSQVVVDMFIVISDSEVSNSKHHHHEERLGDLFFVASLEMPIKITISLLGHQQLL